MLKNVKFYLFIFTLLMCTALILLRIYLLNNDLYIPWPGKQILPSILYIKGYLIDDFYAGAMSGSLYEFTANLISIFFSGDNFEIIFKYKIFNIFFEILSIFLLAILIWCILSEFLQKKEIDHNSDISKNISLIFVPIILVLASFLPHPLSAVFIPNSGGWTLPIFGSLNPMGISWLLTIGIVLSGIYIIHVTLKNILVLSLIEFVSTLIHPVMPTLGLILLTLMIILTENPLIKNNRKKIFIGLCVGYVLAILIIIYQYPQQGIPNSELYQIYVVERHPHHYLPSAYITSGTIVILALQFLVSLIFFRNLGISFLKSITILSILNFLPHVFQYLFVELFQIKYAIQFGPSRLIMAANIIYISSFLGCLLLLLKRLNLNKIYLFKLLRLIINIILRSKKYLTIIMVLLTISIMYFFNIIILKKRIILAERIENHIAQKLIFLNWDGNQVQPLNLNVGDKDFFNQLLLREISGISIYNDNYFPFTNRGMLTWSKRHAEKLNIENCLLSTKKYEYCVSFISNKKIIGLTTSSIYKDSVEVQFEMFPSVWLTLLE